MTEAIFTETLGAWVVRQRRALGVTQRALARSCGVTRSTVCAWERGTRTVSAFQFTRLKECFAQYEASKQAGA